MSLYKKIIILLLSSTFLITFTNVAALYLSVKYFFPKYIEQKESQKITVTQDYIHTMIATQSVEDIDQFFDDAELEFVELAEKNNGEIPLDSNENLSVVVSYLSKYGVTAKYIQTLFPEKSLQTVILNLGDKSSAEYFFVRNIIKTLVIVNLLTIFLILLGIKMFTKKTLTPIKKVTQQIVSMTNDQIFTNQKIEYGGSSDDEIGLLIGAINSLKDNLAAQHDIRNRLVADISHELKTPITSIQCYLEGMNDGVIELNTKHFGALTSEMDRLIKLVNTILEFEKFSNKELELELQEIKVLKFLKDIAETHKGNLKQNNQTINVTGQDILLKCDPNYFTQLVHNLIGNFKKYAGDNTKLTINVTKKYIDFVDNGKGMKSHLLPLVTEKFFQAETSKSGEIESRGIGIGLSIVQKIISEHGWRFQITSQENKGFSFKIFFTK